MKLAPLLLLALLVFPVISQAYAWDLERCYGAQLWILQRTENSQTDGNASVGLGVDIQQFESTSPGQQCVDMNVSMTANSRVGIKYDNTDNHGPFSISWADPGSLVDVNSTLANQVGDEFLAPVNISYDPYYGQSFAFRFFGGAWSAQYTMAYVSSNGFISFDNTTQPSPSPQNASTWNPPNTLIAGLWTDLNITGGSSQIIAGFWSPYMGQLYYVVVWNNVIDKSTGNALTFEIILGNAPAPGINQNLVYTQSQFWIIYHSVSNINQQWGFGVKDQTGNISRAGIYSGDYLGQYNGRIFHYQTPYHSFILNRLSLLFYDANGQFEILSGLSYIKGWNLGRDFVTSSPDALGTFLTALVGTGTLLIGAFTGGGGWVAEGCLMVDTTLCVSSWADTYLAYNQYNLSNVAVFDEHSGLVNRANASAYAFDGAVDASFDLEVHWFLSPNLSVSDNASVVALLDYYDVDCTTGTKTPVQVYTWVALNVYPPSNTSPATAQMINSGSNYSQNVIGNYTQSEFYNISVTQGDVISIWAQGYYLQSNAEPFFSILLNDSAGHLQGSTGVYWNDSLSCVANSSGNWTIEIRACDDSFGYYWVEAIDDKPPGVPTLSGPHGGVVGAFCTFNASTTDPEGDNVTYTFNWTDGSPLTQVGPNASGVQVSASHAWNSSGYHYVTVQAADSYGALSTWSSAWSIYTRNPALFINPVSGSGNTTPAQGMVYLYPYGTNVSVLATPATNWSFSCWSLDGAVQYGPNPIGINMSGDHYLTAHFYYNPPGGGGGGCPYVSIWNGTCYVLDNNVLPDSETNGGNDSQDYYVLQQTLVPTFTGKTASLYSLKLSEFEHEHDHIDQAVLLAVDHPAGVNVAVTPMGEILTYGQPAAPTSAMSNDGFDVLSLLSASDGNYYQGYNGSYLTLMFAAADVSAGAKLVIRSEDPYLKCPIYVQTLSSTGQWNTIASFHTRSNWTTDIINVTGYMPDSQGNFKVRLCFVSNDKMDYVGLDTTPQASMQVHTANLLNALSSSQGIVTRLLNADDEKYAELLPGQQIVLTFQLPNSQNSERTFILYTEGHYETIH